MFVTGLAIVRDPEAGADLSSGPAVCVVEMVRLVTTVWGIDLLLSERSVCRSESHCDCETG